LRLPTVSGHQLAGAVGGGSVDPRSVMQVLTLPIVDGKLNGEMAGMRRQPARRSGSRWRPWPRTASGSGSRPPCSVRDRDLQPPQHLAQGS